MTHAGGTVTASQELDESLPVHQPENPKENETDSLNSSVNPVDGAGLPEPAVVLMDEVKNTGCDIDNPSSQESGTEEGAQGGLPHQYEQPNEESG